MPDSGHIICELKKKLERELEKELEKELKREVKRETQREFKRKGSRESAPEGKSMRYKVEEPCPVGACIERRLSDVL